MIFHQPISVTDLLNKIRFQTFFELLSYIGQITVVRANVHKQPLFGVPQILNAQSEAFCMVSAFAEYFSLRPNPKDVSKLSFRIQNIRKEQSVFKSHVSPSYDFSVIIWLLCPQKGDPFLLCQRRTQEIPSLVIACFVTDFSVILDSCLNLSLAPFLIHSIIAASSKVCKISVAVLYFSQINFKKNKKQQNSQIQELCISIIQGNMA